VTELRGVGNELAKKLDQIGVQTVGDLLGNFPRRYEDYSNIAAINQLRPGQVTIEATIGQVNGRYVRRGLHITEAIASDATSSVRLVWFNQPYRGDSIAHGKTYFIAGEYGLRRGRFSILNPSVELASNFPVNTARIIPVYREVKGLRSAAVRKLVREAIIETGSLKETLPRWLLARYKLMAYSQAMAEIHFPSSSSALERAKRRLGFEEVFELTLAALINKREFTKEKAIAIPFNERLAKAFVAKLPFKLTDAQRKVVWRIYQDMAKTMPMNRLVEGDVGSGKTVVAAMAALMAMEQGFQAAYMAPTEILARQHADTLYKLLSSVDYAEHVGLLIGGLKIKAKDLAHERIASGDIKLIIGTHALIAEKVDMHRLGLIIIDEQHRFGVGQRKKLQAKAGHMPHVLHMSATPIPRSLALTLYGELDISILDEMPPGRQQIKTRLISPAARTELFKNIDKELEMGRQMFVVCPLITDSETSGGLSVEEVYERLSSKDFKHRRVGLLHGKMKSSEKDQVMQKFLNHDYDVLVSTTVIEVGVDVANATIMVIEGAERFGLAQIHQLRGRVGRSQHQSYCYLIPSNVLAPTPRLRVLTTTGDGFKLAEIDLELRGPGAIYGTLQHGALDLRVAKLTDTKLIAGARTAAQMFLEKEKLKDYKQLSKKVDELRAITNLN
jgi:ATP-dependent DNA helicase RecG